MTSPPSKPPASGSPAPLYEGFGEGGRRWTGEKLVDRDRLLDYLLDLNHERGGGKAKFFLGQGFTREHPEVLAAALIVHASQVNLRGVVEDEYGLKFVYEGVMETPAGNSRNVLSVWRVQPSDPRSLFLMTAYPREPRKA